MKPQNYDLPAIWRLKARYIMQGHVQVKIQQKPADTLAHGTASVYFTKRQSTGQTTANYITTNRRENENV